MEIQRKMLNLKKMFTANAVGSNCITRQIYPGSAGLKNICPLFQLVREKWKNPRRCLTSGYLILICDKNVPRENWPLGRVIEGHHRKDKKLRSVKVRTSSTILTRPVTKLRFLEGEGAPLSDYTLIL